MGGSNSTHAHSNYLICMCFIGISTVAKLNEIFVAKWVEEFHLNELLV